MSEDLIARLKAAHEADKWYYRDYLFRENANEIIAVLEAARYYRAEQESGDVHLDSAEALWQDLCAALDAMDGKGRSMLKPHAPMPARNRTHTPDALDAKDHAAGHAEGHTGDAPHAAPPRPVIVPGHPQPSGCRR